VGGAKSQTAKLGGEGTGQNRVAAHQQDPWLFRQQFPWRKLQAARSMKTLCDTVLEVTKVWKR